MRIEIAENQSEITLGQFQEFEKLKERNDLDEFEFNKRKLRIFTPLNYAQISAMKHSDVVELLQDIDKALNSEAEFVPVFKMNDVEFGFIPNFDDIKSKEFFDLTTYGTKTETLHNLVAILFRPIKQRVGDQYSIKEYQGTDKWAQAMKQTPLSVVNGALLFFCSLAMDLQNHILKSTQRKVEKKHLLNILKSGDGMPQFTDSQKERYGTMIKS